MDGLTYFGHNGDVSDPHAFYRDENYVVCRNALQPKSLDPLLEHYNTRTLASDQYYLRQSVEWEQHRFSDHDALENGLLDPHCYTRQDDTILADHILSICSRERIHDTLATLGAGKRYRLLQTMFFDHSTTRPHQDWIYLDSRPNGQLIAAWIALEDIHQDGIRFFVYPGSHHFQPRVVYQKASGSSCYKDFLDEIDRHLAERTYEMFAPPLKKGDIFFWGSRLIHGSVAGAAPERRRRSLAVHFLPNEMKAGNLERDFDFLKFKEKYGMSYAARSMKEPATLILKKLKNRLCAR